MLTRSPTGKQPLKWPPGPHPCQPGLLRTGFSQESICIRSVWSKNVDFEFSLIRNLIDCFPFVSMDTEFPGFVYSNQQDFYNPLVLYNTLKSNVDKLKLIQVGITLSDADGNFPDLGGGDGRVIWEFNFCDFDIDCDEYAAKSILLLRQQGINFHYTRKLGIPVVRFAELMMSSGLVCNANVTYVTFHSGYDFGYLIKAITGKSLPESLLEFMNLLRSIFGNHFYDVKHLIKYCQGLSGGLEKVAGSLGVLRTVGRGHQAGSDSLLTWYTFERIRSVYFSNARNDGGCPLGRYAGILHGLEVSDSSLTSVSR